MWLASLLVASLVVASQAHLCLISPHQRGSMSGINKPAASDCGLTKGDCGGRNPDTNVVGIRVGQDFTVTFQKNLNHFIQATPGNFTVTVSDGQNDVHYTVDDTPADSLTLYWATINIPSSFRVGKGVIRVNYNPVSPAIFYQCADISILPSM